MSPASYRTAPPRVADASLRAGGGRFKSSSVSAEEVEGPGDFLASLVVEPHVLREAAGFERSIGGGEVALGLLQQRLGLGLVLGVARGRVVVPAAGVAAAGVAVG